MLGGLFPYPGTATSAVAYGEIPDGKTHDESVAAMPPKFSLGVVERSDPPSMVERCEVDAAIVRATTDRRLRNTVTTTDVKGVVDIRAMIDVEIPVTMFGAASNERTGVLHTVPTVEITSLAKSGKQIMYEGVYVIRSDDEQFAQEGDSGSIVVDSDNMAVAMVVGLSNEPGDPPAAFATPIVPVLDALNIELVGGEWADSFSFADLAD